MIVESGELTRAQIEVVKELMADVSRLTAERDTLRAALTKLIIAAETFEYNPVPEDGGEALAIAIDEATRCAASRKP